MKKAQATLFMIVMIIGLIGVLIFINVKNLDNNKDLTPTTNIQTQTIQSFIENCIETIGKEAILNTGKKGGYDLLPKLSTHDETIKTAYYIYNNNTMPSKKILEKSLSIYMNENLNKCIKDLNYFKSQGKEITSGQINTQTTITEEIVFFNINYPVTIKKDDTKTIINKFSNEITPFKVNSAYELSKNIITDYENDSEYICLSCIAESAGKKGLYVQINLTDKTLFYTIIDNNTKTEEDYEFTFAEKIS